MTLVASLRDIDHADLGLAGGKAANLGELIRTGFPVPDGFVVTTEAYTAAIDDADLHVANRLDTAGAAALRADIGAVGIPDQVRKEVAAAYARLGGGPVAVRSSATAEDLPGAAFAGQQDTLLNVLGEDTVLDAVRRCWTSLWTDRAVAYRDKHGIAADDVSIAVVVQCMVDADAAGVLFTANPVTGDRGQLVIEANSGLGEAVVSGLVTPDHYVVDRTGTVRTFTPGRHEVVVTAAAGGGVTHEPGDAADGNRLPDAVLGELARLGTDVAEHFGRAQDIEWAYARGRVQLVQARPMTALPPPPVHLNRRQRLLGSVLVEMLPVRPYPIDMTTWIPHGPVGMMARFTEHFGITGAFEGFLSESDGVVDRLVPQAPRPTLGTLRAPFRIARLARRHDPAHWTDDPRFTEFLRRVDELDALDLRSLPWSRLSQVPRQSLRALQPITDLRIAYLPRAGLALARLLLVLAMLRRTRLFRELILGAPTRTRDANRALEALADQVRDDTALRDAVATRDEGRLADFPQFHAAFRAYLAEYGHRETASPILTTPPTIGEVPETTLALITVLAADPPPSTHPGERALSALSEHPLFRGGGRLRQGARVRRWVEAARRGVGFREDSHFFFTKVLPVLRRSLLEMGRRLQEEGLLDAPQDVFHLRLEELEDLGDPAHPTTSNSKRLRETVHSRADTRAEREGVPLIAPSLVFPNKDTGEALVSGTPAGGGVATGAVTVIRDPSEFGLLSSGDVLVCPYTNPAWTPLFQRAAAVVVDSGGPASHAAIVAREYGIPAVMGTARATSVLTDGQLVTVDGDSGRVTSQG